MSVWKQLVLHKGSVRAVAFSPDGSLLATLGGVDDNSVVVWNAETGAAVCGSPAGSHAALTLRWFNNSNTTLVTAGSYNLKLWELDVASRRVRRHRCTAVAVVVVVVAVAVVVSVVVVVAVVDDDGDGDYYHVDIDVVH